MTKKTWTQIAGLASGLILLSNPSRADDNAVLKQLKDIAGPNSSLSVVKVPAHVLAAAGQKGVGYKNLWGIRGFIEISDVKFVAVTSMYPMDPNHDPDLDSAGVGNCVKLTLTSELGVDADLLETKSSSNGQDSVGFYSLGQGHSGWTQPSRAVPIDYFWIPQGQLKDGQSSRATIKFPLSDPQKGPVKGYFEVSARITGRSRQFPGIPTATPYLDVDDVQVRKIL